MFDHDFSAVFVGGVVSALVLALVGCTQPAQVVEVPATVEAPVEVTREVPVTIEVEREILATREVPVTVEVERQVYTKVEVPVIVEVPVTVEIEVTREVDIEVPVTVEVPATVEVQIEVTREVPVTVEVPATVEVVREVPTLVEVTREVEVERRVGASEEAWAVCAKFDETFNSEDGSFRDVLNFMFNDQFDFDAIRPDVLQNMLLLAAKMQLIYWDAEDQDDLWPTLRNSWIVIEHYCEDVLEQPGS